MTHTLTIQIPGLPKGLNGSHGHFQAAAAERKQWRRMAQIACLPSRPPRPLIDVTLVITRFSAVKSDFDNRVAAAKPLIDGLKDAGVILDDTDLVIVSREYPQGKSAPGKGYVEIHVTGTVMSAEAHQDYLDHLKQLELKRMKRKAKKSEAPRGA